MSTRMRTAILSLFILLTSTVGGYLINMPLGIFESVRQLPRVSVYAPLASIVTNLITSSLVSDARSQVVFAASREFMSIQLLIFIFLIIVTSNFALTRQNPRNSLNALLCSFFVIPGILILKGSGPAYLHYRVPGVIWSPFSVLDTALQIALSMPFYALLFLAGVLILTDEQKLKDASTTAP
jgi:hypothetical protein